MDDLSDVAEAIADPVRREILVMLRHAPLTAGEIAERFTITRPAVSRHLRVLRESGLVRDERLGRHRRYSLVAAGLVALAAWLARFEGGGADWLQRLDALDTEVHRTRRERRDSPAAGTPGTTGAAPHQRKDTA
ncbi:metalloregulator ArsR/SmtB family transcription factor [Streptomyces sp. NPDC091377]|uniref:metalloregulator ArsR/SmtB family transcription factor n=1 Tax=Streptomyces sp. NPDC091377 TaxID=3365995 RepID=UPI0038247564